jgi:pilus assembly protein CpaF
MSLRELISRSSVLATDQAIGAESAQDNAHWALETALHEQLLNRLDLESLGKLPKDQLQSLLESAIEALLKERNILLPQAERFILAQQVQADLTGLGPLEPLLQDESITDILVNNSREIFVERRGKLESVPIRFFNDAHLLTVIGKIVATVGRRIDESSPMVDARLPDGSRVNAIIPPLALKGPALSIRRFSARPLTVQSLLDNETLNPAMADFLSAIVKGRCNLLISGGTGTGKTTLLNALSGFIPATERIITIEDAAELKLQQPHVVQLETRPANIEGKGRISQRDLVSNALRMRPDRIIVGEVRGEEVIDMLQAMNTGHEGSMTTIHANTPRDALIRLENIVAMSGLNVPYRPLRQQMVAAFHVIVEIARLVDGRRKIVSIQEILGMKGDDIVLNEIFTFEQTGLNAAGQVQGHFEPRSISADLQRKLLARGFSVAIPELDKT